MPTPQDLMRIGQDLIEHCKAGTESELHDSLYATEAVSVEAIAPPSGSAEAIGLAAIKAKNEWWYGAHELHAMEVEGPFIHGTDRFCVIFGIDVTETASGVRRQMREVATYYVNGAGQIIREEFAYPVEA